MWLKHRISGRVIGDKVREVPRAAGDGQGARFYRVYAVNTWASNLRRGGGSYEQRSNMT